MHEEGFKKALTNVVNKYARAKGLLKEKEENLQGEDIREGLTAIISRAPARARSSRARPRPSSATSSHAVAGRAGHQRASSADWLEENPTEANKIVQEGHRRRPRPAWRPADGPRRHPPQVRARRRGHARQAQGLRVAATPTSASCSSSRATRPAARPSRPATRATRRSCPSAARSSTSSGPASTRC